MGKQVKLGDIVADVVFKDIKNVHLSVYPPTGRVKISAPSRMSLDTIRVFAISKLGWIKQQRKKLLDQERETPRDYLERESHYLWGKRYLLKISECDETPYVELKHNHLVLHIRQGSDENKKQSVIEDWYRAQLKQAVPALVDVWAPNMGVKLERFFVQRMKTKWGSCNHHASSIRLNTDLAKKPRECLEYIVVHELAHLLEPTHNAKFIALMDKYMPSWRLRRDLLNQLPVRHEHWIY